ncbi:hypothetical protein PV10_02710 [Exophiala mesophila]|uniref:Ornithine cyclodeaminase n=1 Tax=Exophiala mesophila TaxID=212818 RepID=A0A0D1Y378_EXOME|nr:uncharacterized protein PV10_02710 [Exophiala mesophila]KIV95001.1 hypothetical protein PV10_02710 [Exophiala mesophila]
MIILKEHDVVSLLSNLTPIETHQLLWRFQGILKRYTQNQILPPKEQIIHQPERVSITTKTGNTTLFMPSSLTTTTGIKVVTVPTSGIIKGSINVFAPDGELKGVLNAGEITAFRTSLAVMIPFVRYSGSKSNIVVFGAGRQAEWHIRLALLLAAHDNAGDDTTTTIGDRIRHITVVNRNDPGRLGPIVDELRQRYKDVTFEFLFKTDDAYTSKLRDTVGAADVIFGCTPATEPHFPYEYLLTTRDHDGGVKARRFIGLIGSYKPHMQEVDSRTILSGDGGRIYVDTIHGCLVEAGELIMANVTKDQLVEVGQFQGQDEGPLPDKGNVIFKCVGLGIMDLFMADELLALASDKGLGLAINDF